MEYTFERIGTIEGYRALLVSAEEKKLKLERRQRNLGEAVDTFRKRLEKFSREAAYVQQTLAAFTTAYYALPEGKHKLTMNIRIKRLEYRQVWLQIKAYTYNTETLVAKELKYNRLHSQVLAITHYMHTVRRKITAISRAFSEAMPVVTSRPLVTQHAASARALHTMDSSLVSSVGLLNILNQGVEILNPAIMMCRSYTLIRLFRAPPSRSAETDFGIVCNNG